VHSLWDIRRFLSFDYAGQVFYMASTAALPLLVVAQLGTASNGHFFLAWMIATCADLVSVNLAQSLTVEAALDPSRLSAHLRRLLPRVATIQAAAAVIVILVAPLLLSIYGADYAREGAAPLRLLMLALLPRAVIVMSIATDRVHRRVQRILLVQATAAVGVLGLAAVLARPWGLPGVAGAWLLTQTGVALVLLPGLLRAARGGSEVVPPVAPAPAAVSPENAGPV
jgi:O-antigen/teichoic acid export membrane protein